MSNARTAPVLMEVKGKVAFVTLNRPGKLNAINAEMRSGFRDAFTRIEQDGSVSVAVVRGAGERAFCTGADMNEIGRRTPMQRRAVARDEPSAIVRACAKPVIVAVHGYVFGGGLELAIACDIRVACNNAVLCFPEITHGWFPAAGGTQTLPRLVGMGKAMELILSGRRITAEEALAIGLVNSVSNVSEFGDAVSAMADALAANRPEALLLAKAAMRMSEQAGSDVGHLYERELGALSYTLEGRDEALAAFAARSTRTSQ